MKQSVKVALLGQNFQLRTDTTPEEVEKIARFAEEQIQNVMRGGGTGDTLQAALLALLNVSALHLGAGNEGLEADRAVQDQLDRIRAKLEKALDD